MKFREIRNTEKITDRFVNISIDGFDPDARVKISNDDDETNTDDNFDPDVRVSFRGI